MCPENSKFLIVLLDNCLFEMKYENERLMKDDLILRNCLEFLILSVHIPRMMAMINIQEVSIVNDFLMIFCCYPSPNKTCNQQESICLDTLIQISQHLYTQN